MASQVPVQLTSVHLVERADPSPPLRRARVSATATTTSVTRCKSGARTINLQMLHAIDFVCLKKMVHRRHCDIHELAVAAIAGRAWHSRPADQMGAPREQ